MSTFLAKNLASLFIGVICFAIAVAVGAPLVAAVGIGGALFYVAHHYFHLDGNGTALGDAGNSGSTGGDSSPGVSGDTGQTCSDTATVSKTATV